MRRVIVDYKKLTPDILDMLVEKYPDGYDDSDIIEFKNAAGEWVEAVEIRTEDTVYLVKVSVKLEQRMESYMDEDEDEDDNSTDDLNLGDDVEDFDDGAADDDDSDDYEDKDAEDDDGDDDDDND